MSKKARVSPGLFDNKKISTSCYIWHANAVYIDREGRREDMNDQEIIERFWQRDEQAIALAQEAYGPVCLSLSMRILENREDAEECVNDGWLRAWNTIPPTRPNCLKAFLLKIVRNLSLNRLDMRRAEKRGGGQTEVLLEELRDCVPSGQQPEALLIERELAAVISDFLRTLPDREATIFLRRYFYMESLREVGDAVALTEAVTAVYLSRTRRKLRAYLKEEYGV